jgi:drug/metabolite transporter (DMT)-like permease
MTQQYFYPSSMISASSNMSNKIVSAKGVYLRLICVPAIWGGTFIAGRIVSSQLPAATSAFVRFVFASVTLLIALAMLQGFNSLTRVTSRQLLGTMALGATGILLYNLCFFSALALMPASRTSLIVALNPVITILVASLFLGEQLTRLRWLGVGIALLGVWVVVTRGDFTQLFQVLGQGELLMLGAVSAWTAYTLIGRKLLQGMSPLVSTTLAVLWGTLMLAPLAWRDMGLGLWQASAFTLQVWTSLAYLGVLGTALAFVWYYESLNTLGAAHTVVFTNLVPVFGVLLSYLILSEPISWSLAIGGAIAVTGVYLVNRTGHTQHTPKSQV